MVSELEEYLVRHVEAGTVPGAVALRGGRDPLRRSSVLPPETGDGRGLFHPGRKLAFVEVVD
jgi:hypothetical protein